MWMIKVRGGYALPCSAQPGMSRRDMRDHNKGPDIAFAHPGYIFAATLTPGWF
jgi:hypothetical protein